MEEIKRGGKRLGAGRKPVLSKKKQISLYVEGAKIIKFGNEEKLKEKLHGFIDGFGVVATDPTMAIQDLTVPTHQIKPIEALKPKTNVIVELPPKTGYISPYEAYRVEISKAKTVKEIEEIMVRVKGEAMIPREKQLLEAYAKEVSKDMFND